MPGITVAPSRTISSVTTPPSGALNVKRGCRLPVAHHALDLRRAHARLSHALRAASRSGANCGSCSAMRVTDRYSS